MRIIAKKTLVKYGLLEPLAKNALDSWYKKVEKADWQNHNDLKEQFGNASK